MGLAYRLRQLRAILTAGPLSEVARREVAQTLTPAERELFERLTPADQWHSYRVLCDLRDAGYNDPDLAAAALLHDIGKTRCPLTAWDRTVIVVGAALWPRRVAAWGEGDSPDEAMPQGWRKPFVVRSQHPAWGAAMAAWAGSRAVVVDLIRRHQDKGSAVDDLLSALQWADDRN